MASKLTPEQRDLLNQCGNNPVPVVDPVTNAIYFLVASDIFERFGVVFGGDMTDPPFADAAQSAVAGKAGWDDPAMDVYDNYDAHKPHS
jgi:hypothetical protein